jgi:hypothetical protein
MKRPYQMNQRQEELAHKGLMNGSQMTQGYGAPKGQ